MIYDVDINEDCDRITLWRRGRAKHRWTRAEAEYIRDQLIKLVPKMKKEAA
jgi:hypothetical protein